MAEALDWKAAARGARRVKRCVRWVCRPLGMQVARMPRVARAVVCTGSSNEKPGLAVYGEARLGRCLWLSAFLLLSPLRTGMLGSYLPGPPVSARACSRELASRFYENRQSRHPRVRSYVFSTSVSRFPGTPGVVTTKYTRSPCGTSRETGDLSGSAARCLVVWLGLRGLVRRCI